MISTVGLDVDGVLADLFTPWTAWLREHTRTNFRTEDWATWSEPERLGMVGWKGFLSPEIYTDGTVEPFLGAAEAVQRLRDNGIKIKYTTALAPGTRETKLAWLQGYGFFQDGDEYCPGSDKTVHGIDLLVDDGFHNVVVAPCPAVLIDQPWNLNEQWGWRADDIGHAVDQILREDVYAYVW